FVIRPTVSDIKNFSIPALVDIANKKPFTHTNERLTQDAFERQFNTIYSQSSKMIKPLLLWEAYQLSEQELLVNIKLEIEHILPKNWKSANYKNWNRSDADEYLEKIGNKVVLDKKTNIQAGDGFFKTKKDNWYKKSPLKVVHKLIEDYPHDDWIKEDIESREATLLNSFVAFAKRYGIIKIMTDDIHERNRQ
ncbi:MAG: HNH endonuclease family protein, partial [Odoribacteraceae bacterium]|nr:HNH endonuclease family protein [Odoribacteraceae bacterium]